MILFLAALAFLLAGLDAFVTAQAVSRSGPSVELNPALRWVFKMLGLQTGIVLFWLYNSALIWGLVLLHWTLALMFLLGVRSLLATLQLRALRADYLRSFERIHQDQ